VFLLADIGGEHITSVLGVWAPQQWTMMMTLPLFNELKAGVERLRRGSK